MECTNEHLELVMAGLGVDRLALKAACLNEERLQRFKDHVTVAYRQLVQELSAEDRTGDPKAKLCLELATEVMRDVKRLRAIPPPQMRVSYRAKGRGRV